MVKVDIDTKAMVGEIIDELKEQGRIHWNIRELIPVKADVNTIRQVWINLLSNAVKYSGHKERPCIDIGSYSQDGQTVFYVRDNGVGFDEEYKDKLFKVFQRLHDPEEFEGTGVGWRWWKRSYPGMVEKYGEKERKRRELVSVFPYQYRGYNK